MEPIEYQFNSPKHFERTKNDTRKFSLKRENNISMNESIVNNKIREDSGKEIDSKNINANIFIGVPSFSQPNRLDDDIKNTINKPKPEKNDIQFKFKNITLIQKEKISSENSRKFISVKHKINNDVFMIEKADEIENKKSKNRKKFITKKLNSTKLLNLTFDNLSKNINFTNKSCNNNTNPSKILNNKTLNTIKNDIKNTSMKNISKLRHNFIYKEDEEFMFSKTNNDTELPVEEIKNLTIINHFESNNNISDSLTDKINNFFINYGNSYNNIEIPFSTFEFSKTLPQEFLNQFNKKDFNYNYNNRRKSNDNTILDELNNDKFNSIYNDIAQDSEFTNFLKEEYDNTNFQKLRSEDVKISNNSEFSNKIITNQSDSKECYISNVIKINDVKTNGSLENRNFPINKNVSNYLTNFSKVNSEKIKIIKNETILKVNNSSILDFNKINKSPYTLKEKNQNNKKDIENSNKTSNLSHQNSTKVDNFTKLIKGQNYTINVSKKSSTSTVHFDKYKQDLKRIKAKELKSISNITKDNKDCLFKKIQISKELKLKNNNKTKNSSVNENVTDPINLKYYTKVEKNFDFKFGNLSNIVNSKKNKKILPILNSTEKTKKKKYLKDDQYYNKSISNHLTVNNSMSVRKSEKIPKSEVNLRKKVLLVNKNERDEFKESSNNVSFPSTQSLDQIYMKLKMQELNEDFERRQKMLDLDKKINNIESEYKEPNVYRKIITISISLIVTGLLLGVLLGLILVMYLNSKK